MKDPVYKLIEYILTKLESEKVSDRVELYDIIADFIPNKTTATKLREYAAALGKVDRNIRAIKLSMSGLCDKFFL
ncbi:MAG: hypothetical protein LBB20_00245 [Puniceicoccales bacterium]|jgi:hypothetical protein|nr:hypothetical protein [Puniceicoccales bacterium]